MSIDRSAPVDELIEALLGSEARRWIKTLPAERQAWLERCGPRDALPEWLIDAERDLTARGVEILDFAEVNLPAGIRERTVGAVGDSIYVMAAARLLPDASPLRERLLPLLEEVWRALNDSDHTSVLLALPEIAGLAGQARQMLDGLYRPPGVGRRPGSGFNDEAFVDEYLRRRSAGERPETLKADIAERMAGGGSPTSKAKRLERAVSARLKSLPSSPMKRRD